MLQCTKRDTNTIWNWEFVRGAIQVEALREYEGSNGGEFVAGFWFWSHSWEVAGFEGRDMVGGVDGGGCYRFRWLISEEGGEAGFRDNWGEFEVLKQGKSGNLLRMVMVVTKIDLLPIELSPTRLEHWVRQRVRVDGVASKLTNVHIIKGKRVLIVQQVKLFHQLPHQSSLDSHTMQQLVHQSSSDSHTVQQLVQEQIVQSLKGLIVIKGLSLVLQR